MLIYQLWKVCSFTLCRMYSDGQYNDDLGDVHLSNTILLIILTMETHYICSFAIWQLVVQYFFNEGINGAGVYFTGLFTRWYWNNFIAALSGAAIYADYPLTSSPWHLFSVAGHYTATFGVENSIFINIPVAESIHIDKNPSSQSSIVHIPQQFNFLEQMK